MSCDEWRMSKTDKPIHPRGSGIQIPRDIADPIAKFAARTKLTKTDIARAGLAYVVPKLLNGEFAIVNGELRPTTKAA
jgi:hypothetical protein